MILMIDQTGDRALSTEEQIALVRQDQEALEKRVALIEAMIAAIRSEDDTQEAATL